MKRWLQTFLPHTVIWYHKDKPEKLTNKQIRYLGLKRIAYIRIKDNEQ